MYKHKQNGGAHFVVIGVVVLVILGAVGFLFWNNLNKPKTATQATSTQKVNPSTAVQPETLALKDWGVQFTITSDLKKAGIKVQKETGPTINADGSEGSYVNYYVSTQRQRDFGQLTEENRSRYCDMGTAVTVIRRATADTAEGQARLLTPKPVNGYYYLWPIPSIDGCEGTDTIAILNSLRSLKSVE